MANSKDAHGFPKVRTQLRNRLISAFNWLTEPASTLNASVSRRARLLTWLHLILFLLTNATNLLLLIANPNHDPRRNEYVVFISGVVVLVIIAYGLNRTGHYFWSAGLTVALAVIGPWGSMIMDPSILQGDFVPLTYVVIPILLCSILLPPPITIGLAGLQGPLRGLLCIESAAKLAPSWTSASSRHCR